MIEETKKRYQEHMKTCGNCGVEDDIEDFSDDDLCPLCQDAEFLDEE